MLNWLIAKINKRQKFLLEENSRLRKQLRNEKEKAEVLQDCLNDLKSAVTKALNTIQMGDTTIENGRRQIQVVDHDLGMEYIRTGCGELNGKLRWIDRELETLKRKDDPREQRV
ncbi:hypothetical protein BIZ83_gp145 [Erwinia phage vB_EamM_ChrisDB]|uniref:hypothetical protein n=1 Tax=Erwinia phage vB_EamM_ChrisDB TaxID=1883371 RepID=UPI00081CBD4F|nr:hypothetical protein BIZ83_gp145 [Erwinia phage vB_EamM_ChrisDB]ANZ48708.1 hypothetical protein CHRISDB_146 [Erwinia phage vB_EamM_ChrisDB]